METETDNARPPFNHRTTVLDECFHRRGKVVGGGQGKQVCHSLRRHYEPHRHPRSVFRFLRRTEQDIECGFYPAETLMVQEYREPELDPGRPARSRVLRHFQHKPSQV